MRLMRVATNDGPERLNPAHVLRLAAVSDDRVRVVLATSGSIFGDGIHVAGTLDEIAVEWAAALQENEDGTPDALNSLMRKSAMPGIKITQENSDDAAQYRAGPEAGMSLAELWQYIERYRTVLRLTWGLPPFETNEGVRNHHHYAE